SCSLLLQKTLPLRSPWECEHLARYCFKKPCRFVPRRSASILLAIASKIADFEVLKKYPAFSPLILIK
ncbi:MAG: hypothetical protein ACRCU2_09090, partial [Planktothrix sp.]